jgi:hypothetical protein
MTRRVELDPEEAKRRRAEYRKRYHERHKDELKEKRRLTYWADPETAKAKRREYYQAAMERLIEAGLYTPVKPGRKRLYTPEEAIEVAKKQRRESNMLRRERLKACK